jgi:hypothetical protein
MLALSESDMTDIISAPNVHFLMLSDVHTSQGFFRKFINSTNYTNLSAFVVSPYVELFFSSCRDLFYAIDDLRLSFEMNEAAVKRFTTLWQKNAILNTKHNIKSLLVSDFFDKFKSIPAIIVSAGPSLSKNISLLKGMEDRCLIISVDTALKPLLENNIIPHFVVSVDGQEIVERKFYGVDYKEIPLIYIPTSSPPVVSGHSGAKILSIAQDSFYIRLMTELGKNVKPLEMGGSVATVAFSFAQHAACNPIILIGQDLAYTDMKTHTEGTAFAKDLSISAMSNVLTTLSVDGGNVYTDEVLLTYLTWFQTYAASDKSGRTYIDASEGGAKIRGYECLSLKETLSRYALGGGVKKYVSEAINETGLLSSDEIKIVRSRYKEAASFIDSIKHSAKNASKQLEIIHSFLSKGSPNYTLINKSYEKIAPFEAKMKNSADKLEIIGIAISPLAEKLNVSFENAEFTSELDKRKFAAKAYAEYYGEIASRSTEFVEPLRNIFISN